MDRWVLALTDGLPDQLQIPILASGLVIAVHAARELDRIYPLGFQMEPFVATPFGVWATLWLGVGITTIGLGITEDSVLQKISLFRFSDGQRTGLVVSGGLLTLPCAPIWLNNGWGLVLYLFVIPAGLGGLAATLLWRLGERFMSVCKRGADSVNRE